MRERNYRPLILQVSWRRMLVLLTGCALALSVGIVVAFGDMALRKLHIALALGFGGVFGAAALLFGLVTVADKHLWLAAFNARNHAAQRSPASLGIEAVVGHSAVVVSAFAISGSGEAVGQVRLEGEIWKAQLQSPSLRLPAVGASVRIVEMRGLTAIVSV